MERRVDRLERAVERIDGTLGRLSEGQARMEGAIGKMADAATVARIEASMLSARDFHSVMDGIRAEFASTHGRLTRVETRLDEVADRATVARIEARMADNVALQRVETQLAERPNFRSVGIYGGIAAAVVAFVAALLPTAWKWLETVRFLNPGP